MNSAWQYSLLQTLGLLLRPLLFAARDNYGNIGSIKGLNSYITGICKKAAFHAAREEDRKEIESIKHLFTDYNLISDDLRKARISLAIEMIGRVQSRSVEEIRCVVEENANTLMRPLGEIKGIGDRIAERFKKKGLNNIEDILYFFPIRYEDRRNIKKISRLEPGRREVVTGEIMALSEVFYGRRKLFEMIISDETGLLKLKWFNFSVNYMKKRYRRGQKVVLYGEVGVYGLHKEMIHPDIEIIEGEEGALDNFRSIVPIYSQIGNIPQKTVRRIVRDIVDKYADCVVSAIPDNVLKRYSLQGLSHAIKMLHMIEFKDDYEVLCRLGRKSIVFDEFFCLECGLALKRSTLKKERGISFDQRSTSMEKLLMSLPFHLTAAQERVVMEIKDDMKSPYPMNRLIQGDVGAGKTIVALLSAMIAIDNGYQVALMAPTEILAEQHFITVKRYLGPLGITVSLLKGALLRGEKINMAERIKRGEVDLIIGTHALIEEYVQFKDLGLVIIDEQHRFGVIQRASLKRKGVNPDILVMTATPIPRTLSMTVFGDLDVSIIDELPPKRERTTTEIFRDSDRDRAYNIIKRELRNGRQAYLVYPIVEESQELELRDATNMKEQLQGGVFCEYRVGLLHGRMKSGEKEAVMREFKDGNIDILVATTVIEVGIDIPNATVMIVEHADRFGLAQLHQLRGRVGRGGHESYCLLHLSKGCTYEAFKRLKLLKYISDGFRLAEEDLRLRGPGDFLGIRQSGIPDFRIANPINDVKLLQLARREAFDIIRNDSSIALPENVIIKEVVKLRWKGRLELAGVG